MKKGTILIFLLIFIIEPWEIRGQQDYKNPSQPVSDSPSTPNLLFNRILVYRLKGEALSGLLVGIDSDSLTVRVGKKDERVFFENLAKVAIETKKKMGSNALYGAFAGTYFGNLIFFWARNQPTAYREVPYERSENLWSFLFAAVGAGAGGLLGSLFEKGEKVFIFTGSEIKRQSEWDRLRGFILGKVSPKKIHLSIQGGHVFTQVSQGYLNSLQNVGYSYRQSYHWYGYYYDYGYREKAADLNLLRKLQLTISPSKYVEAGIAFYWLGEPFIYARQERTNSEAWVNLETKIVGYYIVGIRKLLLEKLPKNTVWNFGVGAGAANVDFSLESRIVNFQYPENEIITNEHRISKTCFSSFVFTEFNIYLRDSLSVGIAADYVFIPAEDAPAMPDADISSRKLRFSTGSIGFTLGLHF